MAHDIVIFSNFIPLPLTISFGALSLLANERFTEDNIIKLTQHENLPQVIENSIAENKTPLIIRQSKYKI